jgi:thiamine-monophosphate kinase
MALDEFQLIQRFFKERCAAYSTNVCLGIGDDCALVNVPDGFCQALSMDTLVSGVHFPETTLPQDIAYKSLAVNLSDLAAMGASPAWFSLSLTLPAIDEDWLTAFSEGLFELANEVSVPLIGGDMTKGSLSITVQIAGHVKECVAMKRSTAKVGDDIYVSGTLGDAAAGLRVHAHTDLTEEFAPLIRRLNRPTPRNALGGRLAGVASSCIDVSDGLMADLTHICVSSQLGADLHVASLPVSQSLQNLLHRFSMNEREKLKLLLGGDDYELCFTAPEAVESMVKTVADQAGVPVTKIGKMKVGDTVDWVGLDSDVLSLTQCGFKHF